VFACLTESTGLYRVRFCSLWSPATNRQQIAAPGSGTVWLSALTGSPLTWILIIALSASCLCFLIKGVVYSVKPQRGEAGIDVNEAKLCSVGIVKNVLISNYSPYVQSIGIKVGDTLGWVNELFGFQRYFERFSIAPQDGLTTKFIEVGIIKIRFCYAVCES
jgi:hypothetical protein